MEKKRKKTIHVVAAVITDHTGRYFCAKRCRSDKPYQSEKWEFPGGKVERGESDHAALIREMKEEMDWDIYVGRKLAEVRRTYPDFIIRLTAYACKAEEKEEPKLLEHLAGEWMEQKQLQELDWAAADRKIVDEMGK